MTKTLNEQTVAEIRNELFIAIQTVRQVQESMFQFVHRDRSDLIAPALLCPIQRQLENVRACLDTAYSHI